MGAANKYRAESPSALLRTQLPAIRVILDRFGQIARDAYQTPNDTSPPTPNNDVDRPHNVFLIDGARGSGKTYTLLSAQYALEQLSSLCSDENPSADWKAFFLQDEGVQGASQLFETIKSSGRKAAEPIRIIFPGDMVGGESIMEAIFAQMIETLKNVLKNNNNDNVSQRDEENTGNIEKILDELQGEVAQGWYFARRFGLEALIRDSLDYKDLVRQWSDESQRASFRIDRWRKLVNDYLNARKCLVMVVLVDDSDVKPELTEDILHAIRMFLNHPRIVTILAGNLKSMRDSLLYRAMERIGPSVPALNTMAHPTAVDWRRRERQMIEEYIEKVLPHAQRIHISRAYSPTYQEELRAYMNKPDSGDRENDDFKKIANYPLKQFIEEAQRYLRNERFLPNKFALAVKRELGEIDAPGLYQKTQLEGFLSWWFFGDVYTDQLAPKSARQIETFGAYYRKYIELPQKGGDDRLAIQETQDNQAQSPLYIPPQPKRLPVVFFDNPSNYGLIHRLSDEDYSVPDWLRQQDLKSSWNGQRYFKVNQRRITSNSYTYSYLMFRLDVGLATPVRDNTDAVIPPELLPKPVGRKVMRRFFQPRQMPRRQRQLGICKAIDHAVLPGNCVYMHHLNRLPDRIFCDADWDDKKITAMQSGAWEGRLGNEWHELVEDRDNPTDDEYIKRYFREIICEALRGTDHLSSADLIAELDPPDMLRKQAFAIYEHFLTDELGSFSANPIERGYFFLNALDPRLEKVDKNRLKMLKRRLKEEKDKHTNSAKSGKEKTLPRWLETPFASRFEGSAQWKPHSPLRMIALYAAMANDLRRAWLAIRVYEGSPKFSVGETIDSESETGQRASLAFIGNRDRMQFFSRQNIIDLLERSNWTRDLLNVMSQGKIKKAMTDINKPELADRIDHIFSAERAIIGSLQREEEKTDFNNWTQTLREIGREICQDWPVRNAVDDKGKASSHEAEQILFGPRYKNERFLIFKESQKDQETHTKSSERAPSDRDKEKAANETQRRNARSARNLVWLLYGLAPSLGAVIHANIMSRVYEAELNFRLLQDVQQLENSYWSDENEKTNELKFLQKERQKIIKRCRELYSTSTNTKAQHNQYKNEYKKFKGALEEIDEWLKLIGTLAVILRYIKIKCLHLDAALILKSLSTSLEKDKPDSTDEDLTQNYRFMTQCKYTIEPKEDKKNPDKEDFIPRSVKISFSKEYIKILNEAFRGGSSNSSDRPAQMSHHRDIQPNLAVFPDVSPSTLFGDDWLSDLLSRHTLSKRVVERANESISHPDYKLVKPGEDDETSSGKHRPPHNDLLGNDGSSESDDAALQDDPLSVTGIFGETEQWLWSANRTLRKLHAVLKKRHTYINAQLEQFER